MSSDLLLAASVAVRAAEAGLALALTADPDTAERLRALVPSGQERLLRIECSEPIAPDVAAITLVLHDAQLRLALEDPRAATATIRGSRAGLLSLRRGAQAFDGSTAETMECTGDRAFALALVDALAGMRPDPLLPLVEVLGPRLPSLLHTARSIASDLARSLFGARPGDRSRAE